MSLSFRCFYLPLLAFLFSLSALNAGESFAADNAKEIKIEDVRKKVEALSFRSISSLLYNIDHYQVQVVLEENKSNLINHYNNTVLPTGKEISAYRKSISMPSEEIDVIEKRYESYSNIIKYMIDHSNVTSNDVKILNRNSTVVNEEYRQSMAKVALWYGVKKKMNEYSKKYQEKWIDKIEKMAGKMVRKTPIGNAFGNTKDATEKYIQAYDKGIMDELNYYNDPNIKSDPNAFNNAMEARPEAVQSARDAAIEAGRTIPGTIGNPPLKKIPYPLP